MTVTASTRVQGHARKVTAANTRQQGMFTIADSYTSRCGCGEYLGSHATKDSATRAHTEHKAAVVAGTFVSAAERAEDPAVVAEREAKMAKWQAEEDKRNEAFARLIERQQARKAAEAEPAPTVQTHRVASGVYEVTKGNDVYDVSRDGTGAELFWYITKRGVDGILSKAVTLDEAKRYIAAGSYDDITADAEEETEARPATCATVGCERVPTRRVSWSMPRDRQNLQEDEVCTDCAQSYANRPALYARVMPLLSVEQAWDEAHAEEETVDEQASAKGRYEALRFVTDERGIVSAVAAHSPVQQAAISVAYEAADAVLTASGGQITRDGVAYPQEWYVEFMKAYDGKLADLRALWGLVIDEVWELAQEMNASGQRVDKD